MPIRELSNAEYHSHLAISNSDLGAAAQSGQAFYDKKFGPKRESTKAFDVGTCFHSLVLPGEQLSQVAAVRPEGLDGRTKAGKAFAVENADKIILSTAEKQQLDLMIESVQRHPAASELLKLKGKAEVSMFGVDPETELQIKARPDYLLDDRSLILDIKTTADASPRGFQRSFANYRYWVQSAWYLWIAEMVTGRRPDAFIFICVEKQRPYHTAVYIADDQSIELGMQEARRNLMDIAKWQNCKMFPGYSSKAEMMSLPKWMLPKEDGTPADHQPIELY